MNLLLSGLSLAAALAPTSAADLAESPACFDSRSGFSRSVWSYCRPVADGVFLYYTPTDEKGNALLGLRAPGHAAGWSSLALAGNGGMKGASQIVVRQDGEGEWVAEDRYSDDYVTPDLDESQDVQLLFATQSESDGTSWGVALRADSCDERDYPVVDRSVWMHWALGAAHAFGFHGNNRGQFKANLMREPGYSPSAVSAIPIAPRSSAAGGVEETETVDIRMPNVDVVAGANASDATNPYICSYFDMEEIKAEHEIESGLHLDESQVHITGFEAIIDPAAAQYVHHMIMYSCDEEAAAEVGYAHNQVVPECGSMPRGCQEMKWPWAVGSADTELPPNVGIPLGGDASSRWLILQMHYYNPALDQNVKDSSGVRVHMTNQLREHDAGFMQLVSGVGSFQRQAMPAGQSTVSLSPSFVVPPTCTDWDEPLNIFGVFHHEHQVGKKMTIEVQRDGENLGPMRLERHFDFNHHSLEESAIPQIHPGDEIVMNCWYDTSSRTEAVGFGEGSQDEMCYGGFLYYPRVPERETMFFVPLDEGTKAMYETACSSPGTEEFRLVSMCAQYYMTDIPTFLQLDIGLNFGAPMLCNNPLYGTQLEPMFPGTCPPCWQDKSCTDADVLAWGQDVVCPQRCQDFGILSLYPEVGGATESAVTHSTYCGKNDIQYFEHTYIEPEQCAVRGDLNFDLTPAEDVPSGGVAPAGNGAGTLSFSLATVAAAAATAILA